MLTVTLGHFFPYSFIFTSMIIKLKSFSALMAKLLQPLNFLTLIRTLPNPATDLLNRACSCFCVKLCVRRIFLFYSIGLSRPLRWADEPLPLLCEPAQRVQARTVHGGQLQSREFTKRGFSTYIFTEILFTSFCHEYAPGTLCALLEIYENRH